MTAKLFGTMLLLVGMGSTAQAATCPTKAQKIKIIDLKSGWWKGDGGDTDGYVMKHITTNCPNVTFKYEHTLYGGFGGFGGFGNFTNFGDIKNVTTQSSGTIEEDKSDFDQIWLLSGGEADGQDIRIESKEFQNYLALMKNSQGNLFVGTGFGNVYHANALTNELGLGKLALTEREVHEYPSPHAGLRIINELTIPSSPNTHPLLKDISVLPNIIRVGEFDAPSDWLATGTGLQTIASDVDGKTVLGEVKLGSRKLILDANLTRTYMIRKSDKNIETYLLNLVTALEH